MKRAAAPGRGPAVVVAAVVAVAALSGCGAPPDAAPSNASTERPNFVVVFTDDQGFADAGCFGGTHVATPRLDRLAAEGMRLTSFCVSQGACTPSRASLMTGCYANRVGLPAVLFPKDRVGLAPAETTIAELLRGAGYATGAFGKWNLGHLPEHLPTRHGFDEYAGLPYSNDMWPFGHDGAPSERKAQYPPLRWVEGEEAADTITTLEDQARLTGRLTARAVDFVERHRDEPFFLYLAHPMPHVPIAASEALRGATGLGPYADVIAEIDASVGAVVDALDRLGLSERTLVVFASDNGPWLEFGNHAGSAGPLREGKGSAFEGGVRVPCIARWPGRIPAGSTSDRLASTIDLLPTFAARAGVALPDRAIDGVDLSALLFGDPGAEPRATFLYWYDGWLHAVREGRWKLHVPHDYRSHEGLAPGRDGFPGPTKRGRIETALFDLDADLGETTDVAAAHPEVVARLSELAERARAELGDGPRRGRVQREPARSP